MRQGDYVTCFIVIPILNECCTLDTQVSREIRKI